MNIQENQKQTSNSKAIANQENSSKEKDLFSKDFQNEVFTDIPIQKFDKTSDLNINTTEKPNFKFDIPEVKIHTNSQLANDLGALAFTQGNNIHFAKGMSSPNSDFGQKVLAHEYTHVAQQQKGIVKPTHTEKGFKINDEPKLEQEANNSIFNTKTNENFTRFDIAENSNITKTLANNHSSVIQMIRTPKEWYEQRKKKQQDESKLKMGELKTNISSNTSDLTITKDDDRAEQIAESIGMIEEEFSPTSSIIGGIADYQQENRDIKVASGALGIVGGIMGLASSISKAATVEKELSFDSVMDYLSEGAGALGAISDIAGGISSVVKGDTAEKATNIINSISGGFGFLKGSIGVVKNGVNLVKMLADSEPHSKDDYAKNIGELIENALDTAKGIVNVIKPAYEFAGKTALDGISYAVPGIDIAFSAVNIIMEGYYLIESGVNLYRIYGQYKEAKQDLEGTLTGSDEEKHKTIKEQESIDAKRFNIERKHAKYAREKAAPAPTGKFSKWRYDRRMKELDSYSSVSVGTDTIADKDKYNKYQVIKELVDTNRKRIVRQSLHITADLINIAGSITTIASGATGIGAAVGTGIKASAGLMEGGMVITRAVKQFGRNIAASNEAKGKKGIANKIFNADKSTKTKFAMRVRKAINLLKMVTTIDTNAPKQVTDYENLIRATGASPSQLYAKNGTPKEQVKLLVSEMSKRELND